MVEQSDTCEGHGYAIFVAGFYHVVVPDRTACLGDICYTRLMGAFDVVAEREECVTSQAYTSVLAPFLTKN